jgi:predicted transcriptional regulator
MKGKSKAGRPKALKPLDRMLSVRIEAQIAADLELIARRFSLSLPVIHRQAIVDFVNKNIAAQALTIRAGSSVEEEPKDDPQGK